MFLVEICESLFDEASGGGGIIGTRTKAGAAGPRVPRLDDFRVFSRFSVDLFGVDQES